MSVDPDEQLYGLTPADLVRLRQLLARVDFMDNPSPSQEVRGKRNAPPNRIAVGFLDAQIAAASAGGNPIPGTLNVYTFSSTGKADSGIDITVYNFAPQIATTDRWAIAERDNYTGKWALSTQFCN